MLVTTASQLDGLEVAVLASAKRAVEGLHTRLSASNPLGVMYAMKFEDIGFHPTEARPLNLIEQLNQTFTYLASVKATRWLIEHHPEVDTFQLNLGTVGGTDIEACDGTVAAEVFAAVSPLNNSKLSKDVAKVATTGAAHKYVFYVCPSRTAEGPIEARSHPEVKVVSLGWSL